MSQTYRILLSPPHMGGHEKAYFNDAFESNWVVPLGPYVDRFEKEFSEYLGEKVHCAALSSGTAAIHIALRLLGVGSGDDVICSDLTFIASVSPIRYLNANPVFVDADRRTWNLDLDLLEEALAKKAKQNKLPKAVVAVHLYGLPLDMTRLLKICDQYEIPVVEDAAESLGSKLNNQFTGTFGEFGVFSFNGNKIITTSGGGMLCSRNKDFIAKTKFLATQARDPAPHYEHSEYGFNYRMSNLLAAVGVGQMEVLEDRIAARRSNYHFYQERLSKTEGITMMPNPQNTRANMWLSCIQIDEKKFGSSREDIRLSLAKVGIETRPVWKPMSMQKVFKDCEYIGKRVGDELFTHGLCLPSGSSLTQNNLDEICNEILRLKK